jgi:Txe/YoeB family toxin of Txe-Axe toxin-antitoxin module
LQVQEKLAAFESQLKAKEDKVRSLMEENEMLSFNNQRLSKRVATMQDQIQEEVFFFSFFFITLSYSFFGKWKRVIHRTNSFVYSNKNPKVNRLWERRRSSGAAKKNCSRRMNKWPFCRQSSPLKFRKTVQSEEPQKKENQNTTAKKKQEK